MKNALANLEIEAKRAAWQTPLPRSTLEGLNIDQQTQADMDPYARCEIELTDVLARLRQRVTADEFRKEKQ